MQHGQINHLFPEINIHTQMRESTGRGKSYPDKLTKLRNIIKMNWEQLVPKRDSG